MRVGEESVRREARMRSELRERRGNTTKPKARLFFFCFFLLTSITSTSTSTFTTNHLPNPPIQETTAFMYETYAWNHFPTKRRMRDWVLNFIANDVSSSSPSSASPSSSPPPSAKRAKVLTYGDGMGIDTCYLSAAGHDTHYYELSQRSINFAKKLSKSANTPITFLTKEGSIPTGAFDFVVCLDVLEHVPDPPALVREIASYLKPGGVLLCSAPFYYVSESASTHLASNKTYSGDLRRLYTPAGLAPVDCAPMWIPIALEKCGEPVGNGGAAAAAAADAAAADASGKKKKKQSRSPKLTPSRAVPFQARARIVANGLVLCTGRKFSFLHSKISEAVLAVEARGLRKSRAKQRLADAREATKAASAAAAAAAEA